VGGKINIYILQRQATKDAGINIKETGDKVMNYFLKRTLRQNSMVVWKNIVIS
jgi:hypothetical protein